jgi:hypothetical protein
MTVAILTPTGYALTSLDPYGQYPVNNLWMIGQTRPSNPSVTSDYWRGLLLFAAPDIPEGSVISALQLRIQRTNGASKQSNYPAAGFTDLDDWQTADISLYRLTKTVIPGTNAPSWNQYAASTPWDTAGGDFELIESFSGFAGAEDEWVEFELPPDALTAWGTQFLFKTTYGETKDWPYYLALWFAGAELVVTYDPPVGRLTLPEWISGDIPVAELSIYQPLRFFLMNTDDTAGTGTTPTVEIRKHGAAAWATPTGTVSELGNGWYQVAYNAADQDTPGQLLLRAAATGCKAAGACYLVVGDTNPYAGPYDANVVQVNGRTDVADNIEKLYGDGVTIGQVNDYSPTAQSFVTDLSADYDDDFCVDHLLVMHSGTTAEQHRVVASYDKATKTITLDVALTEAPANGDDFVLIG